MRFDYIGDSHFTSTHQFNRASFETFLDWWEKDWNGNGILFHCGDLYDKNTVDGLTLSYGSRFIKRATELYDEVYIIGGNHDLKNSIDYRTYASVYLENLPTVHVITEPCIKTIHNKTVMFLPHIHTVGSLNDYYNEKLPAEFYTTNVDYAVGHVAYDDDFLGGIEPEKFPNVKHWICGHVHTAKSNPEVYPGSIMPFKIDESCSYGNRIFEYNDDELTVHKMPTFKQYITVDYDNTSELLDRTHRPVTVYKIINAPINACASDWPNSFIVTIEKRIQNQKISLVDSQGDLSLDAWSLFQDMCEKESLDVSRKALKILEQVLKKHNQE